jgi:hypothetical protein
LVTVAYLGTSLVARGHVDPGSSMLPGAEVEED